MSADERVRPASEPGLLPPPPPAAAVRFAVTLAGVAGDIGRNVDASGRTQLLKLLDNAKRCGEPSDRVESTLAIGTAAIWIVAEADQSPLVTAPMRGVSSVCYVAEAGEHILGISVGEVRGRRHVTDCCLLLCHCQRDAESIIACLGERFHTLFAEATARLRGRNAEQACGRQFDSADLAAMAGGSGAQPSFLSQSPKASGASSASSGATGTVHPGDVDQCKAYMDKLCASLPPADVCQFAGLQRRWRLGAMSMGELVHKLHELFGAHRAHLFHGLLELLAPDSAADVHTFEQFLRHRRIIGAGGTTETAPAHYTRAPSVDNAVRLLATPSLADPTVEHYSLELTNIATVAKADDMEQSVGGGRLH